MPGEEFRVYFTQESARLGPLALVDAALQYVQGGDGMHWRLAEAAGVGWGGRRVGGSRGAGPVLRAGEVALGRGLRVEHDVRHLPVLPLVLKEGEKLAGGAAGVEAGEADGDECGIPAPLVRVEVRRCFRPGAHVVVAQDLGRPRRQPDLPDESGLHAWQAIVIRAHLPRSRLLAVLYSFPLRLLVLRTTVRHRAFDPQSTRSTSLPRTCPVLLSSNASGASSNAKARSRASRRSPRRRPAARAPRAAGRLVAC